jgi:hypothetical protein
MFQDPSSECIVGNMLNLEIETKGMRESVLTTPITTAATSLTSSEIIEEKKNPFLSKGTAQRSYSQQSKNTSQVNLFEEVPENALRHSEKDTKSFNPKTEVPNLSLMSMELKDESVLDKLEKTDKNEERDANIENETSEKTEMNKTSESIEPTKSKIEQPWIIINKWPNSEETSESFVFKDGAKTERNERCEKNERPLEENKLEERKGHVDIIKQGGDMNFLDLQISRTRERSGGKREKPAMIRSSEPLKRIKKQIGTKTKTKKISVSVRGIPYLMWAEVEEVKDELHLINKPLMINLRFSNKDSIHIINLSSEFIVQINMDNENFNSILIVHMDTTYYSITLKIFRNETDIYALIFHNYEDYNEFVQIVGKLQESSKRIIVNFFEDDLEDQKDLEGKKIKRKNTKV